MVDDDGRKRPTIYDVAAEAGVSKSLVSLVLQGSAQVSPARRAAVETAIERLQYRPSQAAAHLAGHRTRTIGVLLDDYRNLWFVELLDGIQETLSKVGFRVTVAASTVNAHVDPTPLDSFLSLRVEGIVIATEPTPAMLAGVGVPVVVAGQRDLTVAGADVVSNDDERGGTLATQHLVDLGHRAIGLISGSGGAARARELGYQAVLRSAGLSEYRVREPGTTEEHGYQGAIGLLDAHHDLTALFTVNDTMAFGAAAAARERGRSIPDDLSLIGYDDTPLASSRLLHLTTIDDRSREVGTNAAEALLARIDQPDRPMQTTFIEPRLVPRATTAPPPSA